MVVGLTPFAPFVLVNVAAGTVGVRAFATSSSGPFSASCRRFVLIAFAGASVMRGVLVPILLLVLAAAIWFTAGLAARRSLK